MTWFMVSDGTGDTATGRFVVAEVAVDLFCACVKSSVNLG